MKPSELAKDVPTALSEDGMDCIAALEESVVVGYWEWNEALLGEERASILRELVGAMVVAFRVRAVLSRFWHRAQV